MFTHGITAIDHKMEVLYYSKICDGDILLFGVLNIFVKIMADHVAPDMRRVQIKM